MRIVPFIVLLAGCSFINRPDDPPDPDAGPDAEVDSTVDTQPDVPDGGVEICDVSDEGDEDGDGMINCADVEDCEGMSCSTTPNACVCRNGRAVELLCGNTADDDNDGTTDCGDFDCAELDLVCCGESSRPAHWPTDACAEGWTERGGSVSCTGTALTEFFAPEPFGIVWRDCLSLALGATFQMDFTPDGDTLSCDGESRCDDQVKLLIAERNEPREADNRFFAELAIAVHASGRVEVLQGDTPIDGANTMVEIDGLSRIRVDLRPIVSESGDAELHASVFHGLDAEPLWDGFVVPLDDLITDGECANVPGFYLVLEGLGDSVRVSQLDLQQSECSNPNLFQPSTDGVLTPYDYMESNTTSLELDPPRLIDTPRPMETNPSWATQALSSPTLLRVAGDWRVAAEASNDQPANEPSFRVGYAIAYRENTTWNDELTGWTDGGSDEPWVGIQPPSCLDGSCTGVDAWTPDNPPYPSVRDPYLFESGGVEVLAFVGEVDDEGEPARTERYGIYVANQSTLGDGELPPEPVLIPSEVVPCDNLRDPVVVPRPGGDSTDFWLFFTCYEGLASRGIWVAPMTSMGGYSVLRDGDGAIAVPPVAVLEPGDLDFGRGGTLRSPEVILDKVDEDADEGVFAMWFLVGQEVGLAIGSGKSPFGDRMSIGDVPVMQLFEGNPVLTPSDRAFNRSCSGCSIEGLAVTRTADTTLRFLIARENDDTPARYDLLPLDQTWRNLARP